MDIQADTAGMHNVHGVLQSGGAAVPASRETLTRARSTTGVCRRHGGSVSLPDPQRQTLATSHASTRPTGPAPFSCQVRAPRVHLLSHYEHRGVSLRALWGSIRAPARFPSPTR